MLGKRHLIVVLICVFLMINDAEHLLMCLFWPFVNLLWGKCQGLCPVFNWGVCLFVVFSFF